MPVGAGPTAGPSTAGPPGAPSGARVPPRGSRPWRKGASAFAWRRLVPPWGRRRSTEGPRRPRRGRRLWGTAWPAAAARTQGAERRVARCRRWGGREAVPPAWEAGWWRRESTGGRALRVARDGWGRAERRARVGGSSRRGRAGAECAAQRDGRKTWNPHPTLHAPARHHTSLHPPPALPPHRLLTHSRRHKRRPAHRQALLRPPPHKQRRRPAVRPCPAPEIPGPAGPPSALHSTGTPRIARPLRAARGGDAATTVGGAAGATTVRVRRRTWRVGPKRPVMAKGWRRPRQGTAAAAC
eukprot:scaffold35181_cov90-Isochrysis_galbana.AAC.2